MREAVFERSLVLRRPNPIVRALAALPLVGGVVALLQGLLGGSASLLVMPHLLLGGLVATAWTLKLRPFARLTSVDVRVSVEGLHVAGVFIPRGEISRALFVPARDARGPMVRVERRWRVAMELLVADEAEAQRLLVALGHDVSRARASFSAWSPLFASSARFFLVPAAAVVGVAIGLRNGGADVSPRSLVALVGTIVALFVVPSRVEVGADGVLLRWLGTARFVPAADIVGVEREVRGFGKNRHLLVRVTRRNGPSLDIAVGGARWAEDDAAALAARVEEVVAAHRAGTVGAAAALARGDLDAGSWLRALRAVGVGAGANFRRPEVDRDALWTVFESPASPAEARVAAAVALAARPSEETATRIRVAADALAEPALRQALGAAASGDDAAVEAAVRALDAKR
jgi:hypothetical protein